MSSAFNHAEWTARGLRDFAEYSDCVEYVNQSEYGDGQLEGEWYYGDDDARVIYSGTFGNYNSPGADCYTYATDYDSEEEYRAALEEWQGKPEYLGSEDEDSEPSEPEEGDYVTEDYRRVYEHGTGKTVVMVPENAEFGWYMRGWMDRDGYWPNVWSLSDHGNWCLINLED